MPDIYCHGEAGTFPETEFLHDENNIYIHIKGKPHYLTGEPLNPPPIPGVPARIQGLVADLRSLALGMSENDLQKLVNDIKNK